ncbi:MAG: sulfatase [Opitutaceae bacterium]|nr:sulfatase [Opitutaceae bacterium]
MKPVALLLILTLCAQSLHAAGAARPNVLFIAIDDLGNVLHSAGDRIASTPHLDRLAATGVRFDRAYNQIPLCNPSRASVLTGLRPDVTGVYDLDRHFRSAVPKVVTLPQLFRENGWFSARVGKLFHYDVPKGIGTDGLDDEPSWHVTVNPKGRDVTDAAQIVNPTPQRPVSAALSWLRAEGTDEEQTDGLIATAAIALLEQAQTKPFFLGVGFFRPHTPFVAPKKYFDLYPLEKIRLPFAPPDDRADIPPAAFAHNNPTPHYGLDELTVRTALQAYYASVSFVDAQVGRLLDALDRLGLARNTIVVVWSDHGYHLGEHGGIWQKRCLFEESARAPLLIRDPVARGNGRASTRVVEFVDLYPTLAERAGLASPAGRDGRSLRPLLDDPTAPWDSQAFTQILRPADSRFAQPVMGRSVRTERWRFTEWNEGRDGLELYDHASDPQEFRNLAADPAHAAVVRELRARFGTRVRGTAPAANVNPARL